MPVKGLQRRKTVIEILTERKLLKPDQLKEAEAHAQKENKTFQQAVLDMNMMGKSQLLKCL
jgi:hypothetical protein